jgi:hypothetical protein
VTQFAPDTGWGRLARLVAEQVPVAEVDRVWCFPVMRQGPREFGTAVIARAEGQHAERRRIYTARYMLQVKGKERGRFEADVQEVGSGLLENLPALLDDAHRRTDDDEPPVEVETAEWFASVTDDAAVG